jgi:hypothetical protein
MRATNPRQVASKLHGGTKEGENREVLKPETERFGSISGGN